MAPPATANPATEVEADPAQSVQAQGTQRAQVGRAPQRRGGEKRATQRPLKVRVQLALRWLHVYTSVLTLILTLFFAATGVLLNHPDWLPMNAERQHQAEGRLPDGWLKAGQPDWFMVAEYLRATYRLGGQAGDQHSDLNEPDGEATLGFKGPGYSADVTIQKSGAFSLDERSEGLLAVIGDLHRGRNTGHVWPWLIDAAGYFLLLIAGSGVGIMLYMKKYRLPALLTLSGGALACVLLAKLAM